MPSRTSSNPTPPNRTTQARTLRLNNASLYYWDEIAKAMETTKTAVVEALLAHEAARQGIVYDDDDARQKYTKERFLKTAELLRAHGIEPKLAQRLRQTAEYPEVGTYRRLLDDAALALAIQDMQWRDPELADMLRNARAQNRSPQAPADSETA